MGVFTVIFRFRVLMFSYLCQLEDQNVTINTTTTITTTITTTTITAMINVTTEVLNHILKNITHVNSFGNYLSEVSRC